MKIVRMSSLPTCRAWRDLMERRGIGNLNNFFSDRSYIASPASCQLSFWLMKIFNVASAGLGGVVVGGARSFPDRAARSNSERAAVMAYVGKRFSAFRLSGINRLTAPGRGWRANL